VRTLQFIGGLGVDVYEGYGLSETCAPVSFNAADATRLGTVGRPVDGVEVKIAEDDEVLVRGPNLLDGYLKDAKATAEALTEDGWFRTGDLGKLDRDGYLSIIGRKKEILITAGGKNISPGKIENDLMSSAPIEHAMLVGDGQRFIAALITVSPDWLEAFALAESLNDASPHHPRVHAEVTDAIAEINPHYARVNQVHAFRILDAPFTQEADELTPTLKMKRKTIMANHAATIDALYAPND
jgi:long-chain acyl-CoA synthetase